MHSVEPHWAWRDIYTAETDSQSPFFGREYSEFEFRNSVYNYVIHPQWDEFGSNTLYLKILYADTESEVCILELIGEWNDCLYNDIMFLKRNVIDPLIDEGIRKFLLIGENVMNFHASDADYYEEWLEDTEGGWICLLNFRQHLIREFRSAGIHRSIITDFNDHIPAWRNYLPDQLILKLELYL